MKDSFEFTLDNPLTEEQWDMIADVDFDRTDRIWFHTKHDKEVEFAKVVRCKNCKYYNGLLFTLCPQSGMNVIDDEESYCSRAERKEE